MRRPRTDTGTGRMARRTSLSSGRLRWTARLRLLLVRKGKGCDGSMPIGVTTGKISRSKNSVSQSSCLASRSVGWTKWMPCSLSSASVALRQRSMSCICSWAMRLTASIWPCGVRPLMSWCLTPLSMRCLSPATRIMKNSSRLEQLMAMKRRRSSKGLSLLVDSRSTRWLKLSQVHSRFR